MRRLLILSAAVTMAVGTAKQARAVEDIREYNLFILAGQSNLVGAGDARTLDASQPVTIPEVLYTHESDNKSDPWGPLQPRLNSVQERRWFGPEITLGEELLAAGVDNPAIIKFGKGGTSLATSWAPGSTLRGQFYNFVDNALIELADQGHTYKLAGFIWVQGSGDSNVLSRANNYESNLIQFVNEIEEAYGETTTFINRYHTDSNRRFVDELRFSQGEFGASSPDHYVIHTDDLPLQSDFIHFRTTTQLEVGRRFAQRYQESLRTEGDYNGDGRVDSADYALWRNNAGSLSGLSADGDGSGVVDTTDYLLWPQGRSDALNGIPSGSPLLTTPEPSSAILSLAILGAFTVGTRRRNRD